MKKIYNVIEAFALNTILTNTHINNKSCCTSLKITVFLQKPFKLPTYDSISARTYQLSLRDLFQSGNHSLNLAYIRELSAVEGR